MATFSERSLAALATCDPRLQRIAHEAVKLMDFTVLEGHRGQAAQDAAYAKGNTQVRWPNSKHNKMPSVAMDIAPYPIDWSNKQGAIERFVFLQGIIYAVASGMGIKIRQGLDWNRNLDMRDESFRDYPHVELVD